MFAARLSIVLVLLGAAGCGASSSPAGSPAATSEAAAPAPQPSGSADATGAGTAAPPADSAAPGAPQAASSPASDAPKSLAGSKLDRPEQELIAMCKGSASIFTEKEEKLLKLAESNGRPDLAEQADAIRARRKEAVDAACTRLRTAGKL